MFAKMQFCAKMGFFFLFLPAFSYLLLPILLMKYIIQYKIINSLFKWYLPEQRNCWEGCKDQNPRAGRCEWCGENGYCCSGTKLDLNHDCPSDGVTYITTQTSTKGHICVAHRNGK